jgi:hypothetical protein
LDFIQGLLGQEPKGSFSFSALTLEIL